MQTLKITLEFLLSQALAIASGVPAASAQVMSASRPEFGDYQANGVMALAKQLRINPRDLAARTVAQVPPSPLIERLEVAGPGFINIHLSDLYLGRTLSDAGATVDMLLPTSSLPQRIVIDYSSPNLAKEMHVGHLRGTIIGDCLVRVLEKVGHQVIRQNHVGDWGTQFGMLIAHLQELKTGSGESTPLPTALADLEAFYQQAKARFDQDPVFAERARANVVRLQSGDPQSRAAWGQFIEESLRHCEAVYGLLGIRLTRNDLRPESFYNDRLEQIVETLDKRSLLSESAGARCVFLPEFTGKDGAPLPVIVQKSDGGYLYATTDLAAIQFRCDTLEADRVLYVVDARQSLHFQQVFAVARAAGLVRPGCELLHIAYGTMMGQDGKPFKTRSGGTVKLVELLEEGIRRAFDLVTAKNPGLENDTRREIARVVGIGAVKYADLSKNRTSDYVFDWDAMLAFDGNTAPYLLYAYTRIASILKKQGDESPGGGEILISEPAERQLAIKLLQFAEVLDAVAADYFPSHLCTYLYELAGTFMRFYEACPILKADVPVRASRLALATLTAAVLREGLELLGLQTLEQM
ncbi:MAG: arginine--tRNA ligase [Pseudomonadota bacterium]